jgi:Uma2 family endonuclease
MSSMPTLAQSTTASSARAGTRPAPALRKGESDTVAALGALTHRFSVKEYYLLADAGIVREDDRVELIEGRILDMSPIGSAHAACVKRVLSMLMNLFQDRSIVSVQDPVSLDEHSEPQPDLMLLRPRDDFYAERHPGPEDVRLVVEVADTSLEYDRQVKIPLYACHAIPEVWLCNLRDHCVEVYRAPAADQYETIMILRGQQQVAPLAFPDVSVTIADLLGTAMT